MPTSKPRLTITLDRPTYEAINGLARVRGVSKTRVIAETMDAVAPVLERIATLIQTAQNATPEALDTLRASAEEAENTMTKMLEDGTNQLDILLEAGKKGKPPVQ